MMVREVSSESKKQVRCFFFWQKNKKVLERGYFLPSETCD